MKIHQITHLFQPDSLGGAALYTDFARFMRERGHDVRVTTTFSYYPRLHYLPEDGGVAARAETFEGIPVRRVAMTLPKRHKGWRRLIPEATFWRALRRHGRFADWRPDVVFTACPMLAQPLAAGGMYGAKTPVVLVVQDLMADAAQRLGIIRLPGLGRVLAAVERRALRRATQLVTIGDEMKTRLRELAQPAREIAVVRNWIHASLEAAAAGAAEDAGAVGEGGRPATTAGDSGARARAGRQGGGREARTLFYSGNLGVKQGLPDFLNQFFARDCGWRLRIHGDGAEAEALRASQASRAGVEIGALLPEPEYVRRLAGTAACLITQRRGVGDSFLPSKLLPALATGTPVLAVCEAASPLGREVAAHGFGDVVEPGDAEKLHAVLARWAGRPDALRELGARARARAEAFGRVASLTAYETILRTAAGEAAGGAKATEGLGRANTADAVSVSGGPDTPTARGSGSERKGGAR